MVEAGGIGEGGRATAGEVWTAPWRIVAGGGVAAEPCVNFWTEWREFSYDGLVSFYMLIFLYQSLLSPYWRRLWSK